MIIVNTLITIILTITIVSIIVIISIAIEHYCYHDISVKLLRYI